MSYCSSELAGKILILIVSWVAVLLDVLCAGLYGPVPYCSHLIYNPNQRHQIWRWDTEQVQNIERNSKVARHYFTYFFYNGTCQISSFIGQNELTEHNFFLIQNILYQRCWFVVQYVSVGHVFLLIFKNGGLRMGSATPPYLILNIIRTFTCPKTVFHF